MRQGVANVYRQQFFKKVDQYGTREILVLKSRSIKVLYVVKPYVNDFACRLKATNVTILSRFRSPDIVTIIHPNYELRSAKAKRVVR